MSSDEKSDDESKSDEANEDSEDVENKKANSEGVSSGDSEEDEDKKDNSEVESDDEEPKKMENNNLNSQVVFDANKLVLSNEIKIDLGCFEKESIIKPVPNPVFLTNVENKEPSINAKSKTRTVLSLLNQINLDLDQLEKELARTIKSFQRNEEYSAVNKSKIREQISEEKKESVQKETIANVNSHSPIMKDTMSGSDYNSDHEDLNQMKEKPAKFYSEKETNTTPIQSSVRHHNPQNNMHHNNNSNYSFREKRKMSPNRVSCSAYANSTGNNFMRTNNNQNRFRTVEDLYKHQANTLPIIYNQENRGLNNNNNNQKILSKKNFNNNNNFPGEEYMHMHDPYESDHNKAKERFYQERKKYKQANIAQAMDILLDKK